MRPTCHSVKNDDDLAPNVAERAERPLGRELSWLPVTRNSSPPRDRSLENDASSPKRVRRHSRQRGPTGGGQVPVNRTKGDGAGTGV